LQFPKIWHFNPDTIGEEVCLLFNSKASCFVHNLWFRDLLARELSFIPMKLLAFKFQRLSMLGFPFQARGVFELTAVNIAE
jgi:hypothetical protein